MSYASTFQGAQNMVIDRLRLDATNDLTRVKDALNQVLVKVSVDTKFFSGSTAGAALAANATSQALAGSIVELQYLTCTYGGQSQFMQAINQDRLLMLRAQAGSSGPPLYYFLNGNTLEFWPNAVGGEILTYYGATLPAAMSANSDTSGLPEPFATNLLVMGACVEMADFKNDARIYTYYQSAYAQWLGQFQAYLTLRESQNSRAWPIYGPDGRSFNGPPFLPHDPSSDYYVTGLR